MTWKQKTVYRILLIIAHSLADDDVMKKSLQDLSNHISLGWGADK